MSIYNANIALCTYYIWRNHFQNSKDLNERVSFVILSETENILSSMNYHFNLKKSMYMLLILKIWLDSMPTDREF